MSHHNYTLLMVPSFSTSVETRDLYQGIGLLPLCHTNHYRMLTGLQLLPGDACPVSGHSFKENQNWTVSFVLVPWYFVTCYIYNFCFHINVFSLNSSITIFFILLLSFLFRNQLRAVCVRCPWGQRFLLPWIQWHLHLVSPARIEAILVLISQGNLLVCPNTKHRHVADSL